MEIHSDELISVRKATELINCSLDRINELCNAGFLTRIFKEDQVYIREKDLYELFALNLIDPINIGKLVNKVIVLEAEIERLKNSINLLFEVNHFKGSKYQKYTNEQLSELYSNIKNYLNRKTLKIKEIYFICGFIIKLTDIDILRLRDIHKDNILKPLFILTSRIHKGILKNKKFEYKLDLQQLHSLMYTAKRNLYELTIHSINLNSGNNEFREIYRRLSVEELESFDLLAKKILDKNVET